MKHQVNSNSEPDVLKWLFKLLDTEEIKKQIEEEIKKIKREDLEKAVKENTPIENLLLTHPTLKLLLNHLHLQDKASHSKLKPILKLILKAIWTPIIEEYLTPTKIYQKLAENINLHPTITKPETKKYLNQQLTKLYQLLHQYTYGETS